MPRIWLKTNTFLCNPLRWFSSSTSAGGLVWSRVQRGGLAWLLFRPAQRRRRLASVPILHTQLSPWCFLGVPSTSSSLQRPLPLSALPIPTPSRSRPLVLFLWCCSSVLRNVLWNLCSQVTHTGHSWRPHTGDAPCPSVVAQPPLPRMARRICSKTRP